MSTIIIMHRNGSSHREIVTDSYRADQVACAEAAANKRTHIVVLHDGDTYRRVMPAGSYRALTTAQCQNLGLEN
jgi:hypothetical protein